MSRWRQRGGVRGGTDLQTRKLTRSESRNSLTTIVTLDGTTSGYLRLRDSRSGAGGGRLRVEAGGRAAAGRRRVTQGRKGWERRTGEARSSTRGPRVRLHTRKGGASSSSGMAGFNLEVKVEERDEIET